MLQKQNCTQIMEIKRKVNPAIDLLRPTSSATNLRCRQIFPRDQKTNPIWRERSECGAFEVVQTIDFIECDQFLFQLAVSYSERCDNRSRSRRGSNGRARWIFSVTPEAANNKNSLLYLSFAALTSSFFILRQRKNIKLAGNKKEKNIKANNKKQHHIS